MVIHKFKSIIGKLVLHFYEIVAEVYQKHTKKRKKKGFSTKKNHKQV